MSNQIPQNDMGVITYPYSNLRRYLLQYYMGVITYPYFNLRRYLLEYDMGVIIYPFLISEDIRYNMIWV